MSNLKRLTILLMSFTLFVLPAVAGEYTAVKTLRVGNVIAKSDLNIAVSDETNDWTRLIGKEVRRPIYVGRVVRSQDVGPITVIQRNDIVSVFYRVGGLGLRTEGRALDSGGVGELIKIMNLSTKTTVSAFVVGPQRTEVRR